MIHSNDFSRNALLKAALALTFVCGLLVSPNAASADTRIVDSSGGGDFLTIQAAVTATTTGPRTIIVKAGTSGTYAESVSITGRNPSSGSPTEANRIIIQADPAAPPCSITVNPGALHAFTLTSSNFITIMGFNLTGATGDCIFLLGGGSTNSNVTIDSNCIHDNGDGGVAIGSGNNRTHVVNNLIRNNDGNGIELGAGGATGSCNPKYVVNNTIFANATNGLSTPAQEDVFLVNNLFVGNGTASGSTGGRRGVNTVNSAQPARQRLINNVFYKNGGAGKCGTGSTFCDIDTNALDGTDSGNRTTNGFNQDCTSGCVPVNIGIAGCTFADCLATHTFNEIFVDTATNDFHLKTTVPISPAIDLGVNSLSDGTAQPPSGTVCITTTAKEWVPAADFEGTTRPMDGDGDSTATVDAGYDEVNTPTLVEMSGVAVESYDGGVLLRWQTGYEVRNLGFNIYRDARGVRTRINQRIIAGSALVAGLRTPLTAGQSYEWWDPSPPGKGVEYSIEDVDLRGVHTLHGPFTPKSFEGKAPSGNVAPLLGSTRSGSVQFTQRAIFSQKAVMAKLDVNNLDTQWRLAARSAVKILVRNEGWYRITQPQLAAAGLDVSRDPRYLQLFVDGEEQPIIVANGGKKRFDASGYIEFFATGLDTAYTDARAYWLVSDKPGLRITATEAGAKPEAATSFAFTVESRERSIYFVGLRNGDADNFFGAVVTTDPVSQDVPVRHLDPKPSSVAILEVALQGVTDQPGSSPDHLVSVQLNGIDVGTVVFDAQAHAVSQLNVPNGALREGTNTVTFMSLKGSEDVSLVDYVRVTYAHTFDADADSLRFTAEGGQAVRVGNFTAAPRVVDLTDPSKVEELTGVVERINGAFAITIASPKAGPRTLLAFSENRLQSPPQLAANQPSSWNRKNHEADLVIIAHRDFIAGLDPLAGLRRGQGYSVSTIDVEDLYNEFGYGAHSPYAIRDFVVRATTAWKKPPRFVLLAGDASNDPRNYRGFGSFDFVPTKLIDTSEMETASDDWFVDLNDDGKPDLAVGRLPARSASEAAAMVSKIVNYETRGGASGVLLVADRNDGHDFESATSIIRSLVPPGVTVEEILRSQLDDASMKQQIIDGINRGPQIVSYAGHGSLGLWRGNVFTSADVGALTNQSGLPFVVTMTCLNGYFLQPIGDSLAEALMKAGRGGAVAAWASSGSTPPESQTSMNAELFRQLFTPRSSGGPRLTLGEAVIRAKAPISDSDVRRSWIFFGDPTTRLR